MGDTDPTQPAAEADLATARKSRRKPRKRKPKPRATADEDESDSNSDCDNPATNGTGPTTEHELKEVPDSIIELPYEKVPEEEMKEITAFGVISSLIDNVLVIKGYTHMGYETVLDEGSMVCWKDGTLIGRVSSSSNLHSDPRSGCHLPGS